MERGKIKELGEKKRVAVYARYSSENQRDESIEGQLRAIEPYCKQRNYQITECYIDRAKSATTDKRPEFQRMIKDAEEGLFEYVLVHKLDRFSRDKYDSIRYKQKLKNNGIKVISVLENLDDSPESVILESVIEGMAEYYSKNLSREVKKGLCENAHKCKHTGGLPPLGYDVDPISKKYLLNEEEAEVVKMIYQMYLEDWTSGNIIKKLNELGYRTKKKTEWTKNSLISILRNEKYVGVYIYNRSAAKDSRGKRNNHKAKSEEDIIRIEGGMPQIIEKEVFEQVRAKMGERKKSPSQAMTKTTYLLSGLVKCECGYSMHGNVRRAKRKNLSGEKAKPEYVSYRCGCRKSKSSIACDNPEIRKEYLEEYVMTELEKMVISNSAIEKVVEVVNSHAEKKESEKEEVRKRLEVGRNEIEQRIGNIIKAVTMGFASMELKSELEKLEEQKSELELKIARTEMKSETEKATEDDVREQLKSLRYFLLSRDLVEVKKFMKTVVKEIVVGKEGIEVTFNLLSSFVEEDEKYDVNTNIRRNDLYVPLERKISIKIPNKLEIAFDSRKLEVAVQKQNLDLNIGRDML